MIQSSSIYYSYYRYLQSEPINARSQPGKKEPQQQQQKEWLCRSLPAQPGPAALARAAATN